MKNTRIVIIAGGSFQGKSIIALEIAYRLKFSGVVTTDMIRNILKIIHPEESYLSTSTYLLPEETLLRQMNEVSDIVKKLIEIYIMRGEHIIIEGMHFSKSFIKWASTENICRICIDNQLSLQDRVILKGITRSRLSLYDPILEKPITGKIDIKNVKDSAYIKYQARIDQIHYSLLNNCKKYGFEIIEITDIKYGIEKVFGEVQNWINNQKQ